MEQPPELTRSLGILIYEMLVGLPPFYSRNKKEMYSAQSHSRRATLMFQFATHTCRSTALAVGGTAVRLLLMLSRTL